MPKVRAHVWIEGFVQGVFFRSYTRDRAMSWGLKGWVRNCPDGRVEAVFEGDEQAVERIIRWCHRGPSEAEVKHVHVEREEYTGEFDTFSIRYFSEEI
jgi:acylphosphatase